MAALRLLLAFGGAFHDYASVAVEAQKALAGAGHDTELVLDDLSCLARLPGAGYDSIVLYHTLGSLLADQEAGLSSYLAAGGSLVGVHSAADSFRDSPGFRSIIGGYFIEHPPYRPYQVRLVPGPEITDGLEPDHFVEDEMYVTSYDRRNTVLATALWGDGVVPVAWCRSWGRGRVFYLALGHDQKAAQASVFGELLRRGTQWACTGRHEQAEPAPPPASA
jgi:uncharacterized protein